jgi:hypothetical protein
MPCTSNDIKILLPAYLEQALDQPDRKLIEDHLAMCEDCRTELALLRMMGEDPVPDPGGAFWQTMPERVFRAVQDGKAQRKPPSLSSLWHRPFLPRWAWATVAVGLVAAASWFMVRPATREIAGTVPPGEETAYEYSLPPEPVNVVELSTTELKAATQWAQNELAPMHEAVIRDAPENAPKDIYEDLMELSPQELDRVYEMLKKKEQDERDRLRRKSVKDKDLG